METTRCFREQVIIKRTYLKEEWIESILKNPAKMVKQDNDDRIRYWGYVKELDKYFV